METLWKALTGALQLPELKASAFEIEPDEAEAAERA